jgi:hypothetical protein
VTIPERQLLPDVLSESHSFGESKKNFVAFFKRLGPCYEEALKADKNLWDTLRNGLAHEYAVKEDCTVYMLKGRESCGIGRDEDGAYYIVIERYFDDFMTAADKLYRELLENPRIPA